MPSTLPDQLKNVPVLLPERRGASPPLHVRHSVLPPLHEKQHKMTSRVDKKLQVEPMWALLERLTASATTDVEQKDLADSLSCPSLSI
jgi:hypothetical protein